MTGEGTRVVAALLADPQARAEATALRPDADPRTVLARVLWNVVTEPGDGVAGALVRELGPRAAAEAVFDNGMPGNAVSAVSDGVRRWRPRLSAAAVVAALRAARAARASLLIPGDPLWPCGIDDLQEHAPFVLWARGDREALADAGRGLAVVGARAATPYGEHVATEISGTLAAEGVCIVSGGAYGIDGAAHRAALRAAGRTIAFLAGGVDRAYPRGHTQLLERIAAQGAVVSEVPCGTAPTRWRFLSRNRLIGAATTATLVVEAGQRSGSLNTAGHAAALGRALGAVPGPVTSAASAGCHRLLREYAAVCVTDAEEAKELMGIAADAGSESAGAAGDPGLLRVADALSARSSRNVPEIARRAGLDETETAAILGLLALEGEAERIDGRWRLVRARRVVSPRTVEL